MMIKTTVNMVNQENYSLTTASIERMERMDLGAIYRLLDEEINNLDQKLARFHQEFHTQFAGYSPEFLSDMIYANKIKLPR